MQSLTELIRPGTNLVASAIRGPVFWLLNLAGIAICVLSGPFGTLEALPFGLRLIYWALSILLTSLLGAFCFGLFLETNQRSSKMVLAFALMFGLAAGLLACGLSFALLSPANAYPGAFLILGYAIPIAAIVFYAVFTCTKWMQPKQSGESKTQTSKHAALFSHLVRHPDAKELWAISAQDHYIEVKTDKGTELTLMRLKDAISLTRHCIGIQIHRSHWIAYDAMQEIFTKNGKTFVRLKDQSEYKVSQARTKELKTNFDRFQTVQTQDAKEIH